jgi:KEOPS complex subunit Pcc1
VKTAEITLVKKGKIAHVVASSLLPETDRKIPRTQVKINEDGKALCLVISAEDTSALRAAINSYLRWISVGIDTYNEIQT